MHTISVADARALDRDAVERLGMPSILLMENAARAVADAARELGDRFVILCGPGNNGGDGLAAARHLGAAARVLVWREPTRDASPDARLQLQILRRAGWSIPAGDVSSIGVVADDCVWIDALFGTGLGRPIEGPAADWVARFNAGAGPKLSIDVPSGLDADTGRPLGRAICRADVTVTFAAAKHGMVSKAAAEYVGRLRVASLGIPAARD